MTLDLREIARYLWEGFLLRDIVAKVIPGALVILGALVVLTAEPVGSVAARIVELEIIGLVFWIGLAWTCGFFVQELGCLLPCRKKWTFLLTEGTPNREAHVGRMLNLWALKVPDHTLKRILAGRERLVVIKEATGNLSLALAWIIGCSFASGSAATWSETFVVILISLVPLSRHRYQAMSQEQFERLVLEKAGRGAWPALSCQEITMDE